MNFLYNIGISTFGFGLRCAALRSQKIARMVKGQRETMSRLAGKAKALKGCVWVHAASLGEFEQGRPMIERLRQEHPDKPILLTFFSPSGYEVRKNYDKVDCVVYLPLDTPRRVDRFLDIAEPSMAIFVKYEFWGNYLSRLKRRGIPTYIISAIFRPSQVFFKPYGGVFRKMLGCFDKLYLQDEPSKSLLESIGITNTEVVGDTRFDRVTDVMKTTFEMPVVERFLNDARLRLIVGSSWEADEDIYIGFLNSHPEIKAVVAPHEMNGDRLKRLVARFANGAVLLSEAEEKDTAGAQVIVVDSFGKLASLYRYGDVAYVGGGFGAGIHNINEAAVYGMPVIFGPKFNKFKEACDLIECKGAFCVHDAGELSGIMTTMLNDRDTLKKAGAAASGYIAGNIGATDRIYARLFPER